MERLVAEGFVPVLHGDGVIDDEAGCAILSADTILEVLVLDRCKNIFHFFIHTC